MAPPAILSLLVLALAALLLRSVAWGQSSNSSDVPVTVTSSATVSVGVPVPSESRSQGLPMSSVLLSDTTTVITSINNTTPIQSVSSTVSPTPTPTTLPSLTILAANLSNEFVATYPCPCTSGYQSFTHFVISPDLVFTESSRTCVPSLFGSMLRYNMPGSSICDCDVLVKRCDVYCCCDEDCSPFDLMGFMCSDEIGVLNQVCLERDDIFRSSLQPCSCSDSTLFCVQTDQNPSRLEYADPELVTSNDQFSLAVTLQTEPQVQRILTVPTESYSNFYQAGDTILLQLSGGELGYFTLPSELNGLHCHDSNPITYLIDKRGNCQRSRTPLSSVCTSLGSLNTYQSFSILQPWRNILSHNCRQIALTSHHGCEAVVVPTDFAAYDVSTVSTVPVALGKLRCKDVKGVSVLCESNSPSSPVYSELNGTCSGVLLEASYTIFHNGTGEILNVSVDITQGTVSSSQMFIAQQFAVRFLSVGEEDVALQRSGSPGYLDGQPVLAGIARNLDVDFSVNNDEWLVLMGSHQDCETNPTRLSINFREDLLAACMLSVSLEQLIDNCQAIKEKALAILFPSPRTHIGVYGNSDAMNITQWVPILNGSDIPEPDTSDSVGLVCKNVVTSLHMQILYAYTGQFDSTRAIITGAQIVYGTEDINAVCRDHCYNATTPSVAFSLQVAVSFIDVSSGPSQLLKSTSVSGKLPQDFLYPFFASSSLSLESNFYLVVWHLLCLITIYLVH